VIFMPKRIEPLEIVDNLADIPDFPDEGEEAAFWGSHRLSDTLLDQMQPLEADVAPPARATTSITLRVDPALLARIQTHARQRHLPYQRLLKQFLEERLQQVEAADQGVPPPANAADPEIVRQTARSIVKLARDLETAVAGLT